MCVMIAWLFVHVGLGRLKLKGFYVEWNDMADVWLYWDDVKSRIIRNVGEKIGFSSGSKLYNIDVI